MGEGGSLINMETDRSQWSLVKYFYLAESISSENTLSYASEMELRCLLVVCVYFTICQLEVDTYLYIYIYMYLFSRITPRGMGLIYPPFLRVSYERVSSSADSTNINVRTS